MTRKRRPAGHAGVSPRRKRYREGGQCRCKHPDRRGKGPYGIPYCLHCGKLAPNPERSTQ
jgi:hypothetical protein